MIWNLDTTNPMVERDPLHQITDASTRRIAWREIKVKLGKMLAGKTVIWSMTPQFTPCIEMGSATNIGEMITVPSGAPRFRGSWAHAHHSDNGPVDYGRTMPVPQRRLQAMTYWYNHRLNPNKMKKHHLIAITALITGVLPMAGCKGGRSTQDASTETGTAHPATAAPSKNSHENAVSTNNKKGDTKYGVLDGDGFPIDPGFAMNSDRIGADQRAALRQNPPDGYHLKIHQNPRFINRKDEEIEWRTTGLEPSSNLAAFMQSLGGAGEIPAGFHPDDDVLFSPSRNRVLIGSSCLDARKVFDLRGDGRALERGSRVRSVTFDDKWRWFIDWKCFLTESLIVGISITDDEIESYTEQHRLYTYDIDSMTLTRIWLSGEIQPKGFEYFQIEAVSAGALLLRLGYEEGREDDLFTLYLEDRENNEGKK